MRFKQVVLQSANLEAQRDFYHLKLGLPLMIDASDEIAFHVGASVLTFRHNPNKSLTSVYHVAFNIPENQLAEASAWLEMRTNILANPSKPEMKVYDFVDWNAHAFYFKDGEGNIMEFIARHNLPTASDTPFDQTSILNISEVGLPTPDVRQTVAELTTTLGIPIWRGEGSDSFTVVGDEHGLFIVVKDGRVWMGTVNQTADILPTEFTIEDIAASHQPADLPYRFIQAS